MLSFAFSVNFEPEDVLEWNTSTPQETQQLTLFAQSLFHATGNMDIPQIEAAHSLALTVHSTESNLPDIIYFVL